MTSPHSASRALAVDLRHTGTAALLGVAVVVPSERYAATLADGAPGHVEPQLTAALWSEIDAWAAAGDEGLPGRPAPMSAAVASALLGAERPAVDGRRFASIPMWMVAPSAVGRTVVRLLPRLLEARRAAS